MAYTVRLLSGAFDPIDLKVNPDSELKTLFSQFDNGDRVLTVSFDGDRPAELSKKYSPKQTDALFRRVRMLGRLSQVQFVQDQDWGQISSSTYSEKDWLSIYKALDASQSADDQYEMALALISHSETAPDEIRRTLLLRAETLLFLVMDCAGREDKASPLIVVAEEKVHEVARVLDLIEDSVSRQNRNNPFFLLGMTAPVSVNYDPSKGGKPTVVMNLAVPLDKMKDFGADWINDYRLQLNPAGSQTSSLRLRPIAFEKDEDTVADDPYGDTSTFHINHKKLAGSFERELGFYRVTFEFETPPDVSTVQKYDVEVYRRSSLQQRVYGSFVIRTPRAADSMAVATDLHLDMGEAAKLKAILDGIKQDQEAGKPLNASDLRAVEHFYASANSKFLAFCDETERALDANEISGCILLGDLVDFVHYLPTLERQGFHMTNMRRFQSLLERYKVPVYGVYGNHDCHGQYCPAEYHETNFPLKDELNRYFSYVTKKVFPQGTDVLTALNGLAPIETGVIPDFLTALLTKFGRPGNNPLDSSWETNSGAFINHYYRNISPYDCYSVSLGNGFRLFSFPTGPEDMSMASLAQLFGRNLISEFKRQGHTPGGEIDPLKAVIDAANKSHLNGVGPGSRNISALAKTLEAAKDSGERVIANDHFPLFNNVTGPVRDEEDVLDEDTRWAMRILADGIRDSRGRSVLAMTLSGHVHETDITNFKFHFDNPEERQQYETQLADILSRGDESQQLFADLRALRTQFKLDDKLRTHRFKEVDDTPAPEFAEVQAVTVPALGINSNQDGTGYGLLNLDRKSQSASVHFRNLYIDPQKRPTFSDSLMSYRIRRYEELRDWNSAYGNNCSTGAYIFSQPAYSLPEHSLVQTDYFAANLSNFYS